MIIHPITPPAEKEDTELEPLYRVIIHNDAVTPMNYVVHSLTSYFYLGMDAATKIMLEAHINGSAHVQTLSRKEAHQRVLKARFMARVDGYPLDFSIEPEA